MPPYNANVENRPARTILGGDSKSCFSAWHHSAIPIGVIPEFGGHIALAPTNTMPPILLIRLPANFGSPLAHLPALTMSPFITTICVHDDLRPAHSH